MKTTVLRSLIWSCSLAAITFFLLGCSKQDAASTPTTEDAQKAAAPDNMKQTADSVKVVGETMVSDATKQTQDAAAAASTTATTAATAATAAGTSKAQEWIDKAKSLVAQTKYSEAASVLQQLSSLKLTDEQQKLVDTLKEQIQKALASKATGEGASAVGNLLKK